MESVRRLIYLAQIIGAEFESTACIFEVTTWTGSPHVANDDDVTACAFVPMNEALIRLANIPFANMREPILAYLRGEAGSGAAWFYREKSDGSQVLITRLVP